MPGGTPPPGGALARQLPVAIIGTSTAEPGDEAYRTAGQIAGALAHHGLAIICGGRHGVMEAACRGATEAGGLAIGILGEDDLSRANAFATVQLPTGLGTADNPAAPGPPAVSRNRVIACAAACLVAVAGGHGTADEIAHGGRYGKTVFGICGAPVADPATLYPAGDWERLVDDVVALFAPPAL